MRKQAYLAALAAVTLVSCQQEQSFRGGSADRNEIAFTLQGAETRSEGVSSEKQGVSIPLGTVNGVRLSIRRMSVTFTRTSWVSIRTQPAVSTPPTPAWKTNRAPTAGPTSTAMT